MISVALFFFEFSWFYLLLCILGHIAITHVREKITFVLFEFMFYLLSIFDNSSYGVYRVGKHTATQGSHEDYIDPLIFVDRYNIPKSYSDHCNNSKINWSDVLLEDAALEEIFLNNPVLDRVRWVTDVIEPTAIEMCNQKNQVH